MKKFIEIVIGIIISIVFMTVFIRSNQVINNFIAKNFFFYFSSVFIFLSLTIFILFQREKFIISINKLDIVIILYYTYSSIRLFFTKQNTFINNSFINISIAMLFYFVFKGFFQKYRLKLNSPAFLLLLFFCISGFLEAVIGLLQAHNLFGFYSSNFTAVGSFDNPSPYAGYISSVLPFAFGLYLLLKKNNNFNKILKYMGLLTFTACILLLPLTKERGDWLAALSGMLVVVYYKYDLGKRFIIIFDKAYKKILMAISVVALISAMMVGLYNIRPVSAFGRILMWKVTTNIIKDYPVFGAGYGRFSQIYGNYQAKYFAGKKRDPLEIYVAGNVRRAHNEFIQHFAELGIIGFLLLSNILFTAFFRHEKLLTKDNNQYDLKNKLLISSKASLTAITVSSMFAFPLQIIPTYLNFILMLSIISSFGFAHYKQLVLPVVSKVYMLAAMILISFFAVKEYKLFESNKKWKEAKILTSAGIYKEAIQKYYEIYNDYDKNGDFLVNYGGALYYSGKYKEALVVLSKAKNYNSSNNLYILLGKIYHDLGNYKRAELSYKKAINIIPNRLYPKFLLVKSYLKNNNYKKAKQLAEGIINMEAKFESTAEKQIKNELSELLKQQNPGAGRSK